MGSANSRVEKFSSSGTYLSQFGTNGAGNGQLNEPKMDVTIDSLGNFWVADTYNSRVEEFDSNGNYLSQFGTYGSGNGRFIQPWGIAIDGSGNVWVTEFRAALLHQKLHVPNAQRARVAFQDHIAEHHCCRKLFLEVQYLTRLEPNLVRIPCGPGSA
jgi:DNA-binding beta-propeller fold protein YncE